MSARIFATPTPAQQRGALGWLMGVLAVLACLVALAGSPVLTDSDPAEAEALALLTEPPPPDLCPAEIEPVQDTVDREATLTALETIRAARPFLRLHAQPSGRSQFESPPPQRPPRLPA